MSNQSQHDRRDIVGVVRKLLADNWNAANVYGVDTSQNTPNTEPNVYLHTGSGTETINDPQIVVESAGETPWSARGSYAVKADGTGHVRKYDGTLDVRCVGGTEDDTGAINPRQLTRKLADEVQEIAHNHPVIAHPDTLEPEYDGVGPGQRRGPLLDDDDNRWYAVQEVRYSEADDPPQR